MNRLATRKKTPTTPRWGLLPAEAINIINRREWLKVATLKARLLGEKEFPIRLGLKPPSASLALANMGHFQKFVGEWQGFKHQKFIQWSTKNFRDLAAQNIPTFITLNSIEDLIIFLGSAAHQRSKLWQKNMLPILELDKKLYPALIKHLNTVENLSNAEAQLLAELLPQLKPGMGQGIYQRAIALIGIDTKFLENHQDIITDLLDIIYPGSLSQAGDLGTWLQCQTPPKNWLTIRPLCPCTIKKMADLTILKMTSDTLHNYELPAKNIIAVENMQSGLALPTMPDTIAVIGGGKNITWLKAPWLKKKNVAYWGDIDTWGLAILSKAREFLPQIQPLMMDQTTVDHHKDRIVTEPEPITKCPTNLRNAEAKLFTALITGKPQASRLEQERLSSDYIHQHLKEWLQEVNNLLEIVRD